MSWGEAYRLTGQLLKDPASHVATALNGWQRPWPAEAFVLADLYDLTHKIAAQRRTPKPYPRPTDAAPKRFGRATRSQHEIRAALRARGHA